MCDNIDIFDTAGGFEERMESNWDVHQFDLAAKSLLTAHSDFLILNAHYPGGLVGNGLNMTWDFF